MSIPYKLPRLRRGTPADGVDRLPEPEGKRTRKSRADKAKEVLRDTVPIRAEHDPGAYN